MTTTQYSLESGPLEVATATWSRAKERLDHLRTRKVRDSSPFLRGEYQKALTEFESACLARRLAGESRGRRVARTNQYPLESGPVQGEAATWITAKARLEHLRIRKVSDSSPFVKREYQRALAEFKHACVARKFAWEN
jgi:hypothetical protein